MEKISELIAKSDIEQAFELFKDFMFKGEEIVKEVITTSYLNEAGTSNIIQFINMAQNMDLKLQMAFALAEEIILQDDMKSAAFSNTFLLAMKNDSKFFDALHRDKKRSLEILMKSSRNLNKMPQVAFNHPDPIVVETDTVSGQTKDYEKDIFEDSDDQPMTFDEINSNGKDVTYLQEWAAMINNVLIKKFTTTGIKAALKLKEELRSCGEENKKIYETIQKSMSEKAIALAYEKPFIICAYYAGDVFHLCISKRSGKAPKFDICFIKGKNCNDGKEFCGWIFRTNDFGDTFTMQNNDSKLFLGVSNVTFEQEEEDCYELDLKAENEIDDENKLLFSWDIKSYGENNYKLRNWKDDKSRLHIVDRGQTAIYHFPCIYREGICLQLENQ